MPIPVTCPNCGTRLNAPDAAAGKKVKCPRCAAPFPVPNPGEEPMMVTAAPAARPAAPPPPRDYEPERQYTPPGMPGPGPQTGLQMGLGIASLALGAAALVIAWIPCVGALSWPISGVGLVLGVVGLIIAFTRQGAGMAFPIAGSATSLVALGLALYWIFVIHRATSDVQDFANRVRDDIQRQQQIAQQQLANKFNNPQAGPAGEAPPVQEGGALQLKDGVAYVSGNLTNADPKDKVKNQSPCKVYTVSLAAGKPCQIDLVSQQFDAYLRLETAAGQEVARDDDSGGNLNARIVYTPAQAGEYRVIATALPPAFRPANTGTFTLKVQQK